MQYKMFLIKYAEIGTKGKNRYVFEEIMCKRMRARLKPLGKFEVFSSRRSRITITRMS